MDKGHEGSFALSHAVQATRRAYHEPRFREFGDVRSITQGGAPVIPEDDGAGGYTDEGATAGTPY